MQQIGSHWRLPAASTLVLFLEPIQQLLLGLLAWATQAAKVQNDGHDGSLALLGQVKPAEGIQAIEQQVHGFVEIGLPNAKPLARRKVMEEVRQENLIRPFPLHCFLLDRRRCEQVHELLQLHLGELALGNQPGHPGPVNGTHGGQELPFAQQVLDGGRLQPTDCRMLLGLG